MKAFSCSICRDGFAYFNGVDGKPICVPCFLHDPTEEKPSRDLPKKRRHYKMTKPDKYAAHRIVEIAKGSGLLKEQPCEVCGAAHAIHAHHEDYSKPLDVKWLCAKHHGELHGRQSTSV